MYRYDGRGALGDLRIHEPPAGGFDQRIILTEDELKVEQLCDEERYRSLYNNDAEDSMYHGMFRVHIFKALNMNRCFTSNLLEFRITNDPNLLSLFSLYIRRRDEKIASSIGLRKFLYSSGI